MSRVSLDRAVRLLRELPFFAEVSRQDLLPIAAACRPRFYRSHQIIFEQGDPGDTFHLIQSGQVRIVLSSPKGGEILLALMHPGDFFGELSLLDGLPRSATAVANKLTVTLTLARPGFLRVLERTPPLAHHIMLALSARLRRTNLLLGDSVFLDVPARLAKRLRDLAGMQGEGDVPKGLRTIRVTQRELAAMVGATRETINRELQALESRGVIRVARGRILLFRPEGLEREGLVGADAPHGDGGRPCPFFLTPENPLDRLPIQRSPTAGTRGAQPRRSTSDRPRWGAGAELSVRVCGAFVRSRAGFSQDRAEN